MPDTPPSRRYEAIETKCIWLDGSLIVFSRFNRFSFDPIRSRLRELLSAAKAAFCLTSVSKWPAQEWLWCLGFQRMCRSYHGPTRAGYNLLADRAGRHPCSFQEHEKQRGLETVGCRAPTMPVNACHHLSICCSSEDHDRRSRMQVQAKKADSGWLHATISSKRTFLHESAASSKVLMELQWSTIEHVNGGAALMQHWRATCLRQQRDQFLLGYC